MKIYHGCGLILGNTIFNIWYQRVILQSLEILVVTLRIAAAHQAVSEFKCLSFPTMSCFYALFQQDISSHLYKNQSDNKANQYTSKT